MSASFVRFSCTSLVGTNKVGNLKKTEDGYYRMVVGGLNVFNSAGEYYVFDEAKELFTNDSSALMRRVSRGALNGENGHPKMLPGMTYEQFANRVLSIHEDRICCHHRSIELDFENVRDSNGKPIIAIVSELRPAGELGYVLEQALNNPSQNVCFSIRAFTDDYREARIVKRVLKSVVTFDHVNEPGIAQAEKYKSPSLESIEGDGISISRGQFIRGLEDTNNGIATEAATMNAGELFKAMNWDTSHIKHNEVLVPKYTKW